MKKLLCAAALLAVTTTPALAQEYRPYVGVDYQLTRVDFDGAGDENLHGANIHVGTRFDNNFGVELGYFRTQSKEASGNIVGIPVDMKGRMQGVTLDGLGYLPMTDDKKLELVGTAGVSYNHAKIRASAAGVTESASESEWGVRVGAGAQYAVTDQVNVRGLARYQSADFDDFADGAWVYTLGMNYGF